jgi:tetratricopeptide (TPR) repeat protein
VAAVLLRKKRPVFAFGIAFFIVGQLLESTMLPLELAFEHRNYLPSYGLLLAAADMVRALDIRGFAKAAIGIVVVVLFALVLRLYVERWASYPKLMEYAAQTHPTSPQVMATIAGSLTAQGRYRDAIDLLATRPTLGGRFQTLYILCLRDHRLSRGSLQDVESSMLHPLDPYAVTGLVELAREGLDDNCSFDRDEFLQLADTALQRGIRDTAGRFKVHLYKAHYLWAMRRRDAAIREALAAQEVIPTDPVALFLATEWRISLGRMVEAKNSYDQAVRIAKASDKDYGTYIKDVGKMFAEPGLAAHWLKGD